MAVNIQHSGPLIPMPVQYQPTPTATAYLVYQPPPTVITPTCQSLAPPPPLPVLQPTTPSMLHHTTATIHSCCSPTDCISASTSYYRAACVSATKLPARSASTTCSACASLHSTACVPASAHKSHPAHQLCNTVQPQYTMPQSPYSFQPPKQPVPVPELPKLLHNSEREFTDLKMPLDNLLGPHTELSEHYKYCVLMEHLILDETMLIAQSCRHNA